MKMIILVLFIVSVLLPEDIGFPLFVLAFILSAWRIFSFLRTIFHQWLYADGYKNHVDDTTVFHNPIARYGYRKLQYEDAVRRLRKGKKQS